MINKEIYSIWTEFINNDKYKQYFKSNEEKWIDTLNKVIEYIDKYHKKPLKNDKDNKIKYLEEWISKQQRNYNKKEGIIKNIDIYNKWSKFINDSKYKEYFMLNKELYINNTMKYICKSCNYKTKYFVDITRHINRVYRCKKELQGYNFTEEEIIKLSLIPYINNKQNLDIKTDKNKTIINKKKLFELLHLIEKNKLKKCPLCNEIFNKIIDLRNHLILNCISLDLENNSKNNNSNNSTINEINRNNNIHVYRPISFDNYWDISHLSNAEKNLLIISMDKYTKTLEYLLKNKSNHNVLIDKETNSGLIYKNNIIEKLSIDEICDQSFDKLYNHLNSFYKDSKNINIGCVDPEYIDIEKKSMKIKYFNYKDDENNNKNLANNSMIEIFNQVKDETLENFNKIEKLKENIGY